MKLLSPCEGCRRRSLIIHRRTYYPTNPAHKVGKWIRSQSDLCGRCYRAVKKMLNP